MKERLEEILGDSEMRKKTKEFWKMVYGETRFHKFCAILGALSLAFVFAMIIYELANG